MLARRAFVAIVKVEHLILRRNGTPGDAAVALHGDLVP
jgi:hypothetical protein